MNRHSQSLEIVISDGKKKYTDKNEAKVILKKYIKHCLPRHLVKKTNTYFVRGAKTPKKTSINMVKVHRKVISQNNINEKIDNANFSNKDEISVRRRTHSQTSFGNIATMQLKENKVIVTPDSPNTNFCILCCEREPNAVFMDCGHGGMCYICCIKMWKNGNECHICRSKINEVLQITLDKKAKGKYSVVSATFTLDQEKIDKYKQDYENDENNKINESSVNNISESNISRDVNISIIDI